MYHYRSSLRQYPIPSFGCVARAINHYLNICKPRSKFEFSQKIWSWPFIGRGRSLVAFPKGSRWPESQTN